VSALSLNSFKGRIDKYWNDCQFSLDLHRLPVISQKDFQKAYLPKLLLLMTMMMTDELRFVWLLKVDNCLRSKLNMTAT